VAARTAADTISSSGTAVIRSNPAARTARLTSIPGLGSASRAGPMGISGEAATATPAAIPPPAVVTMATLASARAAR